MVPHIFIASSKKSAQKSIDLLLRSLAISHSSVISIEKDGATLKIDDVRSIAPFIERSSTNMIAVIIYDFETAKDETQNTLLKTLEEDSERILFILVTSDEAQVLPTIRSRSKVVRIIKPVKKYEPINVQSLVKDLLPITDKVTREKATQYIDSIIDAVRLTMKKELIDKNDPRALQLSTYLKECQNARYLLIQNNLNPQMVLDHLVLNAPT